jgi:hypothetical protein
MYQSLHARVEDLLETEMGAALSGEYDPNDWPTLSVRFGYRNGRCAKRRILLQFAFGVGRQHFPAMNAAKGGECYDWVRVSEASVMPPQ